MKQTSLLITLAILCCGCAVAWGQIIYVKQGAQGDGSSWENAFGSVQQALAYARAHKGVHIWVAGGVYVPCTNGDRNASFHIPDGTVMLGGFAGHETSPTQRNWEQNRTILSGEIGTPAANDNSYTVVYTRHVSSATIVDGFIITGGMANGISHYTGDLKRSGAGWYNDGSKGYSNPTILNCVFTLNRGRDGAALYNSGMSGVANPRIENCRFINNYADLDGGAIFNNGSSGMASPLISNCLFEENEAQFGAGIFNLADGGEVRPTVTRAIFRRNLAYTSGSSVYNARETGGISDAQIDYPTCIFHENRDKVGQTVCSTTNNEGASRSNSSVIVKTTEY